MTKPAFFPAGKHGSYSDPMIFLNVYFHLWICVDRTNGLAFLALVQMPLTTVGSLWDCWDTLSCELHHVAKMCLVHFTPAFRLRS